MEEMKIGMRVRAQFRSALDRQVGEGTCIMMDTRKGVKLMNSIGVLCPD